MAAKMLPGSFSFTIAQESFAEALVEWRMTVEKKSAALKCTPMRLVRNLVADTPKESLAPIYDALKYLLKTAPLEPVAEHVCLLEFLDKHIKSRNDSVGQWLVFGGKPLGFFDFCETFGSTVEIVLGYERQILRPANQNIPLPTVGVLATITRKFSNHLEEKVNKKPRRAPVDQIVVSLVEHGFKQGLQPLSRGEFDSLPMVMRRWFLHSPDLVSFGLSDAFREEVHSHPDSPVVLESVLWEKKIVPSSLRALKQGKLEESVDGLWGFLRDDRSLTYSLQIRDALLARTNGFSASADLVGQKTPKAVLNRFDERTRNLLRFHFANGAERLLVLKNSDLQGFIGLFEDTTPGQMADAVHRCLSEEALQAVARLYPDKSVVRLAVNQAFKIKGLKRLHFRSLGGMVLKNSGADDLAQVLRANPDIGAVCDVETAKRIEFAQAFLSRCKNHHGLGLLLHRLPQKAIVTLLDRAHPVSGIRSEIAAAGAMVKNLSSRSALLAILVRHAPDLIESSYGWKISFKVYQNVAKRVLYHRRQGSVGELFRFSNLQGKPHWEIHVKKNEETSSLRRGLRRDRPDLVPSLDRIDAMLLLKQSDFRKRLIAFLNGGSKVEIGVSESVLRQMGPWVRKRWARTPTVAVAYEIAVTLSPRDSRYLLALCTQRAISGNARQSGTAFDALYRTVQIPKRSGGTRNVNEPNPALKRLQRRFLANGFDHVPLHPAAHGFRKGRSILTNAKPHAGKPVVLNVDVEGFFPSTRYAHILHACNELAGGILSPAARYVVADLCSYQGALPTGAPTSPAIGNIVLRAADASIAKAMERFGVAYTRYADDLTFSGSGEIVGGLRFVEKVLGQLGYNLNRKKTNIFRRGRRQMVTGLVVNVEPHVPRRIRRRIRAAAHRAGQGSEVHWKGQPMSVPELEGRIAFLQMVHPEEGAKLKEQMAKDGPSASEEAQ